MKITKTCSECGGDAIYMAEVSASGGHGPDLLPGIGEGFWQKKSFEIYICGKCGYAKFFVPERFLAEVTQRFKRV